MSRSTADVSTKSSAITTTPLPLGMRLLVFAGEQLQQAQAHLVRKGEALHEGIHQARKSIRRARATLALGARVFGPRAQALDDELGRLCRGLSHLRDAQALIEVLQRLEAQAPDRIRAILPAAERLARERRDDILERALVRDPAFQARGLRLQAAQQRLARLGWRAVDETEVSSAMKRSQRRADKAAKQIKKNPEDDEAWHVYRRRLRRLRQQDSLLAELLPALRLSKKRARDLADVLGESQDDALLLRHCDRRSPFPSDQRKQLRAIARERLRRTRSG
ncbi:MAG: CHAD domain-containing protein [Lysobacter sp.]|nr:CHAD domain-containing protein [Lysobacter sp.]